MLIGDGRAQIPATGTDIRIRGVERLHGATHASCPTASRPAPSCRGGATGGDATGTPRRYLDAGHRTHDPVARWRRGEIADSGGIARRIRQRPERRESAPPYPAFRPTCRRSSWRSTRRAGASDDPDHLREPLHARAVECSAWVPTSASTATPRWCRRTLQGAIVIDRPGALGIVGCGGLMAEGRLRSERIYHLDRGYERSGRETAALGQGAALPPEVRRSHGVPVRGPGAILSRDKRPSIWRRSAAAAAPHGELAVRRPCCRERGCHPSCSGKPAWRPCERQLPNAAVRPRRAGRVWSPCCLACRSYSSNWPLAWPPGDFSAPSGGSPCCRTICSRSTGPAESAVNSCSAGEKIGHAMRLGVGVLRVGQVSSYCAQCLPRRARAAVHRDHVTRHVRGSARRRARDAPRAGCRDRCGCGKAGRVADLEALGCRCWRR